MTRIGKSRLLAEVMQPVPYTTPAGTDRAAARLVIGSGRTAVGPTRGAPARRPGDGIRGAIGSAVALTYRHALTGELALTGSGEQMIVKAVADSSLSLGSPCDRQNVQLGDAPEVFYVGCSDAPASGDGGGRDESVVRSHIYP